MKIELKVEDFKTERQAWSCKSCYFENKCQLSGEFQSKLSHKFGDCEEDKFIYKLKDNESDR